MLVRALFVVLMTVGPQPFRVCTCGACPHESGAQPDEHDAPAQPHRHSHHHRHECPAVNAHPISATKAEAPAPVVPADASHAVAALELVCVVPHPAPVSACPKRASVVPIYLSLCTLRN